ncbi:excisionase family DNA-binding protein [Roseburia zhanii]|nr:excisionase family DNA-binding protein [Roseburia zhanii]
MDAQEKKFTEQDMSNFMSMLMIQQDVNWRMEMQTKINALENKVRQLSTWVEANNDHQSRRTGVEMVSIKEASQRSGISYDFIRKMCINKQISYVRAGSKYLVNWRLFQEYLNKGAAINDDLK